MRLKLVRWQGEVAVQGRNQAMKMLLRRAMVQEAKMARKSAQRRS